MYQYVVLYFFLIISLSYSCNNATVSPVAPIYANTTIICIDNIWHCSNDVMLIKHTLLDSLFIQGSLYLTLLPSYKISTFIYITENIYINSTIHFEWDTSKFPLFQTENNFIIYTKGSMINDKSHWFTFSDKLFIACVKNSIMVSDSTFFQGIVKHGFLLESFSVEHINNCSGDALFYNIKNDIGPYIKNNYEFILLITSILLIIPLTIVFLYYMYKRYIHMYILQYICPKKYLPIMDGTYLSDTYP